MRLPLKAALLAGIPLVIMSAIGASLLMQGQTADGRSTLTVGVIVAAVSSGTVIYQIDRWSLPKQSLVHLALMTVTVLPALLLSGWFPLNSVADVLPVVGVFAATGVVLWTVIYTIYRLISARAPGAAGRTR